MKLREFLLFLIGGTIALSACSLKTYPPNKKDMLNHIIAANENGDFIPLDIEDAKEGGKIKIKIENAEAGPELDQQYQQHLKKIGEAIQAGKHRKILIFVHGGLNALEQGLNRAGDDFRKILGAKYYPIFINWKNEGVSSYFDQLTNIRGGQKDCFAPLSSPLYLISDVARSVVNAPEAWWVEGQHSFLTSFSFFRSFEEQSICTVVPIDDVPSTKQKEEQSCKVRLPKDYKDVPFDGISRILWIGTSPIKLITTPFVYTLGDKGWKNMKRRSYNLIHRPAELNTEKDCYQPTTLTSVKGSGVLSLLMKKLKTINKNQELSITLIGHSMGAIVLNKVIQEFPELYYENIVYMAAAASIRDVRDALVPYLQEYNNHKNKQRPNFYNLSLHPEAEDRETNFFGTIPSGSLLVYIDSMYETPETRLDRTFGRWSNIENLIGIFPKEVRGQMHFRIFGFQDGPTIHGDFDNDQYSYWKRSYWFQ